MHRAGLDCVVTEKRRFRGHPGTRKRSGRVMYAGHSSRDVASTISARGIVPGFCQLAAELGCRHRAVDCLTLRRQVGEWSKAHAVTARAPMHFAACALASSQRESGARDRRSASPSAFTASTVTRISTPG